MLLSTSSSSLTEYLIVSLAERIQTQLLSRSTCAPSVRRCAGVRGSYPADRHAGHALGN